MKILKKIVLTFSTFTVVTGIGYFVYQIYRINYSDVNVNLINNKVYKTLDKKESLTFISSEEISLTKDNNVYQAEDIVCLNNNLKFNITDSEYYFYFIDYQTVYSKTLNKYFYEYIEEKT